VNKRGQVMPEWLGNLIIILIVAAIIITFILVTVGPKAEEVTQSDIIYRIKTMSFGDRGVTGAIVDSSTVVCFGNGASKTVYCLNRNTGSEVFTARLLTKDGYAMSKPALVSDGIIVGFGRFVCKYDLVGDEEWCQTLSNQVTSDIVVDSQNASVTCFESGKLPSKGGVMTCLDAKTGDFKFSVEDSERILGSTPAISKAKNAVYFASGNWVCKYSLDKQGLFEFGDHSEEWCAGKFDHTIRTDIVLGYDKVCFDSSPRMRCVNENDGSDYLYVFGKKGFRGGGKCPEDEADRAVSTPKIYNGSIYFGMCSYLWKIENITNTTGSQNFDATVWAAGDFSKPLRSGSTVGVIPPIPDVSRDNQTVVCIGSGADKKIACVWDYGDSTVLFVSLEGKWEDCPRVKVAPSVGTVSLLETTPEYADLNVHVGDRTCYADSTPALSGVVLYYALGNRICATNLTSLKTTGVLTLNDTSSKPTGGIAKWCKDLGSSDLLYMGTDTWASSVTDLAIYDELLMVAQPKL